MYFLAIAALRFVTTLYCPASHRGYNFFFEREFPSKMTLSGLKPSYTIIL